MIRFSFDSDSMVFTAYDQRDRWNGWLTPIVDRDTLTAVIHRMNLRDTADGEYQTELRWQGDNAMLRQIDLLTGEEEWALTINPDSDGRYLLDLGLTIAEID